MSANNLAIVVDSETGAVGGEWDSRVKIEEKAFAETFPKFIVKRRTGQTRYYQKPPPPTGWTWAMTNIRQVSTAELQEELRITRRRWYATDKRLFLIMKDMGCPMSGDGEPFVVIATATSSELFWIGNRLEPPKHAPPVVIISFAELFLKSLSHQARMIRQLISGIQRITQNQDVLRCGNSLVQIRGTVPSDNQMKLLALLPGIAKIYEADVHLSEADERGRSAANQGPCGRVICDGAQGMPIQRDQVALCLMSGGLDSPVATYKVMGRGCFAKGIHFLNSTSDTAAVVEKNRRIAKALSLIQGSFQLSFVDISKIQSQIVANVPNHNRTLVYKWLMMALAAAFDDSCFIVVGDSIGQVASQTVHNISTMYPTISKAVIAPLVGIHKTEVMDIARKIGTYDHSIVKANDCCQYMMCKIGANLFIGTRALLNAISGITLSELPVITELFVQGEASTITETVFAPSKLTFRSPNAVVAAAAKAYHSSERHPAMVAPDRPIYFDAAAGTALDESVQSQILACPHGNPSSLHSSGRAARMAIERVRAQVAAFLGVPASDIIFTSGGTEANNIALHSFLSVRRDAWSHPSTSGATEKIGKIGVARVIDLVHHETGSVATNIKRNGTEHLHVDACQAICKIDLRKALDMSQVDSLAFTAHKFNGPVGAGVLYFRDLPSTVPLMFGGSQEYGLRPGTENVPAIVGLGAALRLHRDHDVAREVESVLRTGLQDLGCTVNYRGNTSGYIVHATLPEGVHNVDVVALMSTSFNVEIGTGSACKTGHPNTGLYDTLGIHPAPIDRSIRLSYDNSVTVDHAEFVLVSLSKVLKKLKKEP
jgi:cysteine sulfinate desulfinase/cysteine desulfurase-like protein/adenylyl- and sulfurtransferase ThiI